MSIPKNPVLPTTGKCPLCGITFNGLNKHYQTCAQNFAKLKTNLLLVGKDALQNKAVIRNHKPSGVSKTCEACNKRYIYRHNKCSKRPTAPQSNTDCPFNFSDMS